MKFSANLGFLWKDQPLVEQIRLSKAAGFDAVECHRPYETPWQDTKAALAEAGFEMVGINTVFGPAESGGFGLAAIVGKEKEAREIIDQAIEYAANIGSKNVHVLAGITSGDEARAAYISQLTYAATKAATHGITILIEPINPKDVPGFYMNSIDLAASVIVEVGADNLKIMFDCYHIALIHGDIIEQYKKHVAMIGHIQIAGVPDRMEPDHGDVDYQILMRELDALGYKGAFGAEYNPRGKVEDGLGWLADARKQSVTGMLKPAQNLPSIEACWRQILK